MKKTAGILLILFAGLLGTSWLVGSVRFSTSAGSVSPTIHSAVKEKVHLKGSEARLFAKENGFNESVTFLIDMNIASGQPRFFIYNLKKDSIIQSGLVTHGRCNEDWLEGRKYGNTVGCGCSSLGKYKIGISYHGRFGLAYKLHGLESTNNKAYERYVVLHAHACVPETPTTDDICQSDGCPTVSPLFLQQLKKIINPSKKPILLWIYE